VVAVIAYNAVVFLAPAPNGQTNILEAPLLAINTLAGALMTLRVGDALMAAGLFLFFIEIVKISNNISFALGDQILSMVLFVFCLVEFLIIPEAATSVFFVILVLALLDVISSFVIQIRFARRDISVEGSPDLSIDELKG